MTLAQARQLRDDIRAAGYKATVPLGSFPEWYGVKVTHGGEVLWFNSREAWEAYRGTADAAKAKGGGNDPAPHAAPR